MTDESLNISDLHFSDKPNDEFMWNLFPQAEELVVDRGIRRINIAGDLHEAKSGFTASFVNQLADALASLADKVDELNILSGNHDGISSARPYMEFVRHIPKINFYTKPHVDKKRKEIWLPHSRDPVTEWADIDLADYLVFAHITVSDASSELGHQLHGGISSDYFAPARLTLGGDVHTPGKVGHIEYIGSPYATKMFASNEHKYRGVILNHKTFKLEDHYFKFPRRITVDVKTLKDYNEMTAELTRGDQVKVRFHVNSSNINTWRPVVLEIRQALQAAGLVRVGFDIVTDYKVTQNTRLSEPANRYDPFNDYCSANNIDAALVEFGEAIIKGNVAHE